MPAESSADVARRRLLVSGLGAAAGGVAALVVRPAGALAAGSSLLTPVTADRASTRPDVVTGWFDQVAVTAAPFHPPVGAAGVADRMWAISWMSALAAVSGGSGDALSSSRWARFEDAAVVTAVHDALVGLAPDQASRLDAALATSLAAIPDGDAKQAGIRAGQDAAARVLADRQGDGLDPVSINRPYTPPPGAPGIYRLPPGATATEGAGLGLARPFLLGRADRFRPGPPPAVGSEEYRRGWEEVRRSGRTTGSERNELQSDIAWLAPGMQYGPALRALLQVPGHPVRWKVRLLAAYAASMVDAAIAVADGKFAHLHWRPVTAIRSAATDGDRRTAPDPEWTSYLPTPPNPDWPSGHGAAAGAAEKVLEHFVGPRTPAVFTAGWRRGDGKAVTRTYPQGTRWSTLTRENVDARVWAGVHFRFSDEAGATLGRSIGRYDVQRLERA